MKRSATIVLAGICLIWSGSAAALVTHDRSASTPAATNLSERTVDQTHHYPRPRRVPATRPASARRTPGGGVWGRLASCESAGRWHINTGNRYYGGLQEALPTWDDFGGRRFAARPDLATRAEQITVAARIQHGQGWGAWPVCAFTEGIA